MIRTRTRRLGFEDSASMAETQDKASVIDELELSFFPVSGWSGAYIYSSVLGECADYSNGNSGIIGKCYDNNYIEDVNQSSSQQKSGGLVLVRPNSFADRRRCC